MLLFLFLVGAAANPTSCIDNYDPNEDYFPDKTDIKEATTFSVEYQKSYKVVTLKGARETRVVAYQCGTPKPNVSDAFFVRIPVKTVAFESTTFIPFIELLGERESIKVALTSMDYVSSPCLKQRFNKNMIQTGVKTDSNWKTIINATLVATVDLAFVGQSTVLPNGVAVAETEEKENLGRAEYIKFFSVFYNQEHRANQLYQGIVDRTQCLSEYGSLVRALPSRTNVLWCSYAGEFDSGATDGWDCGTCPNYYCEAVAAAGASVLDYTATNATTFPSASGWYPNLLSDTEFAKLAADADLWVYTGSDFATAYGLKSKLMQTLNPFKTRQIFGTHGKGGSDWFESRLVEPDVVLEDLLAAVIGAKSNELGSALGPALKSYQHNPVWVRSVWVKNNEFANTKNAGRGVCVDDTAPSLLQANVCVPPPRAADALQEEGAEWGDATTIVIGVLAALLLLVGCFSILACKRMKEEKVPLFERRPLLTEDENLAKELASLKA